MNFDDTCCSGDKVKLSPSGSCVPESEPEVLWLGWVWRRAQLPEKGRTEDSRARPQLILLYILYI
jgi:hypothetical protein